jgi:glycine cleavage system H protein
MALIRYTKDHEYISVEGDIGTIGITDHAQSQLGDVVFVELPNVGASFDQGNEAAVVESVKAASEIYAPVAGEVVEVNDNLEGQPAIVNEDAMGKGWFLKIKITDTSQLDELMTHAQYEEFLKTLD